MMKETPVNSPQNGTAQNAPVKLISAKVMGRAIEAEIDAVKGAAPKVEVFEGDTSIGIATAAPESEGTQRFVLALPESLYDGEVHTLRLDVDGAPATILTFAGDPHIPLPVAARKLLRAKRDGHRATSGTPAESADSLVPQSLLAVMNGLMANSQALQLLVAQNNAARTLPGATATPSFHTMEERYGDLFADASRKLGEGDVVWLGVIDWDFRIQRPQHLAAGLADRGRRVFYVSIVFEAADEKGRFRIVGSPYPGVYEVRLRLRGELPDIYRGFSPKQVAEVQAALDEALTCLHVYNPTVVVQYPSWYLAAASIPGATVVHDCLDLVEGFSNVPQHIVKLEEELIRNADLVVVSSAPLAEHVEKHAPCVLIRNGAEVEYFARASQNVETPSAKRRPVIGYFGAIAEWFDADWVTKCAAAHPEWDFTIIGSAGRDVTTLAAYDNVHMLGELPYSALPTHLADFDVAIIPFKLIPLIMCTNPVKLYEYMAAGKPVVASAMPEVVAAAPGLVYIAKDGEHFQQQIAKALEEDTPALQDARKKWALQHDWAERAREFDAALRTTTPDVSVIVLSYNNWGFTQRCLHSVRTLSAHPNFEIVVVDNGSSDGTPEHLTRMAAVDPRVKPVLLPENTGFAAGNNAGIKAARGEYIILLNNDTYVTRGWIRDLIRPLQLDSKIGLAGPLTNNIGNEQKISIHYSDMHEMAKRSHEFVLQRLRRRFSTENLAFFCVATRRDVIERVGMLDEGYGLGFFEDDDYCQRVLAAGYEIVVVDDVFVHHHLSASFDELGSDAKAELMEKNKERFCEKWSSWKPHTYRSEPGFGA